MAARSSYCLSHHHAEIKMQRMFSAQPEYDGSFNTKCTRMLEPQGNEWNAFIPACFQVFVSCSEKIVSCGARTLKLFKKLPPFSMHIPRPFKQCIDKMATCEFSHGIFCKQPMSFACMTTTNMYIVCKDKCQ